MVIRQTGWRTGQRQLIVGPLYHAAPFTAFLDALLDSNTVVLQPFFAPQWTVELVRRYAIEWLQLTPAHMREILRLPDLDPAGFASSAGDAAHRGPLRRRTPNAAGSTCSARNGSTSCTARPRGSA